MDKIYFKISTDYTRTPGPRYEKEGPYSAELLLRTKLDALFREAMESNRVLSIDLDDTAGYATSFLEGIFGALARKYTKSKVLKFIEIVAEKKPWYKEESLEYINDVEN
jgi:hypothetical protein